MYICIFIFRKRHMLSSAVHVTGRDEKSTCVGPIRPVRGTVRHQKGVFQNPLRSTFFFNVTVWSFVSVIVKSKGRFTSGSMAIIEIRKCSISTDTENLRK